MNVLTIMGRMRSGKDTVGQMIKEITGEQNVATLAFADRLKELCMELYGLSHDDVYTDAGKDKLSSFVCYTCPACKSIDTFTETVNREVRAVCRKCTAVAPAKAFESYWTNRMILQYVGTEGCRRVDPNVWVNFAMRAAQKQLDEGKKLVVITDCRFRSELAGVQKAEGSVWRLRRPETDKTPQGLVAHASETEMDAIPDSEFQTVLLNNGTLQELREKVKAALGQLLG